MRRVAAVLLGLASFCFAGADEDFRPRIEAPRLLLPSQRLRLLKREAERMSPRWQVFARFATGDATLPEPGLAKALYYRVSGDKTAALVPIDWAAGSSDIRQIALVLDWCGPAMSPEQRAKLAAKLPRALPNTGALTVAAARDHAFAALALADIDAGASEQMLKGVVERWWRQDTAPRLITGQISIRAEDEQALLELLHVVNDNLRIDLREDATSYFRILPRWHALTHKPRPVASEAASDEGEYFEPLFGGSPVASRAAGLALVAFDSNWQDSQFLQGWLMQDRATMRGAAGAPYEFLWANPYLPGLSYHHMPSWIHDPDGGRFAMRSSWDDGAQWVGTTGGPLKDGAGNVLALPPGTATPFGAHALVRGVPRTAVGAGETAPDVVVFTGLDPGARYQIQNGSDRTSEVIADRNGLVAVTPAAGSTTGIRLSRGKGKAR